MRLRGEAGNEVTQQQRNVEEMLERAARTEQRDAAQELADKTQARPNVAQTPRRMMAGIACTLGGGVLWGVNGSVSKILMEQYDASPMWVACVREIFAGLIFLACGAIGSPKAMRKAFTTVRDYPMYLVTALTCVTLVQVAYLFSIHWTNAGTATVLQTVNLLMVLVYVCVRGRRKPTVREVVGVALAFAGVWLLATGGDLGALSLPLPGLLWGLADAFACACLAIIPVKLIAKYGNFVVNPEQAPIVKEIFRRALSGEGAIAIARDLNERGIPTGTKRRDGSDGIWNSSMILSMIKNVTYTGDVLMQETYSGRDYRRRKNT